MGKKTHEIHRNLNPMKITNHMVYGIHFALCSCEVCFGQPITLPYKVCFVVILGELPVADV